MSLYILDADNNPVPVDTVAWGEWYTVAHRNTGLDYVTVPVGTVRVTYRISTVFLGINHNFLERGDPVLWETMIFSDGLDYDFQRRYTSHAAALAGHRRVVELLTSGVPPDELDAHLDR